MRSAIAFAIFSLAVFMCAAFTFRNVDDAVNVTALIGGLAFYTAWNFHGSFRENCLQFPRKVYEQVHRRHRPRYRARA